MAKKYACELFSGENFVNRIVVSDMEFLENYCKNKGYTYKLGDEIVEPYVPPEVPVEKRIDALEQQDEFAQDVLAAAIQFMYMEAEYRAKMQAQQDLADDALAELAQKVYAESEPTI